MHRARRLVLVLAVVGTAAAFLLASIGPGLAAVVEAAAPAQPDRDAAPGPPGLDAYEARLEGALDPTHRTSLDRRLAALEKQLRESVASGWTPPWRDLAPALTGDQVRAMPTAKLATACFASGLPARTLLIYDAPDAGIKRLEVLYPAFAELLARPDCWKGLLAVVEWHAAQLDPEADAGVNVNAMMGLATLPKFYVYPPLGAQMVGHEREVVSVHVAAMERISGYLEASAGPGTRGKPEPFFAPPTVTALVNAPVALSRRACPEGYRAARAALSDLTWPGGTTAPSDAKKRVDTAVRVLKALLADLSRPRGTGAAGE